MGYEFYWDKGSLADASYTGKQAFVLVGKGVARAVSVFDDGKFDGIYKSANGMKVVYGEFTVDGRPNLRTSNVFG